MHQLQTEVEYENIEQPTINIPIRLRLQRDKANAAAPDIFGKSW